MTAGTISAQNSEDIAFARALHGEKVKSGLLANLSSKNADVHNVATDTYLKMWKESDKETIEDESKRLDGYTSLVNSYYNLATDFYEYGKYNIYICMNMWVLNCG
jgi:sterol 24-C-methyltransferase